MNSQNVRNLKKLQSIELSVKKNKLAKIEQEEPIAKRTRHNEWRMIAMYAEKGGVGKTTITASIGFMLASRRKRVLLYDCDPQRNLTNWCFGKEINVDYGENLDEFIHKQELDTGCVRTFYDQVDPPDLDINELLKPAHALRVYPNLYLVMGNRDTCLLDERISMSEQNAKGNFSAFNVYTGRTYLAIKATVEKYQIDYVLLDLSPVRGTLNRRLISLSDYLIVPCYADYYGYYLMSNLPTDIELWNSELRNSKDSANRTPYKIPDKESVKFLGFIINNYHPCKGHFAIDENGIANDLLRRNQHYWFDKIVRCAENLPVYGRNRQNNLLAKIRNYWNLEQISSLFFVPVPLLKERHAWKTYNKKKNKDKNAADGEIDSDELSEEEEEEEKFERMSSIDIHASVKYVDYPARTRSGTELKKRRTGKHGFLEQVEYFKKIFTHLVEKIIDVVESTS